MDWAGNPDLVEQIRTMATEGLSATQIALAMGMGLTRNMVCGIGFRKGISFKGLGGSSNHTPRPRKPRPEPMFRPKRTYRNVEAEPKPEPFGRKTLMELGHGECKYPFGDRDFKFCADPVHEGLSWCVFHAKLVYEPPESRRDR